MNKQEKWWKLLPISIFTFGVLVGILAFTPDYSKSYLLIGIIIGIIATISALSQRIEGFAWSKIITIHAGLLFFFLIGARLLLFYVNNELIWIFPFLIAYIVAWLIPYLNYSVSQLLFQEQTNPQTQPGKTILNLAWALLPIVGGGGAFLGMYLNRSGQIRNASIFLGPLFMIIAIGWAQVASHQLWQEFFEKGQPSDRETTDLA